MNCFDHFGRLSDRKAERVTCLAACHSNIRALRHRFLPRQDNLPCLHPPAGLEADEVNA
jgi:hypothetical protein